MTPLVQDLWDLEEKQSEWTKSEFQANDHGFARLQRFLNEILVCIDNRVEGITHGYVALSGIECGWFSPVSTIRRAADTIGRTSKDGANSSVAGHLGTPEPVVLIDTPAAHQHYKGDPNIRRRCIIKLIANQELFGFIVLDSLLPDAFKQDLELLKKAGRALCRIVAAAVFSMRLRILGAPVHLPSSGSSDVGLRQIALELASRTAYGFGADGAILRLYTPDSQNLEVVGLEGEIPAELRAALRPGEGIAGRIFDTTLPDAWFLSSTPDHADEQIQGTLIDLDERAKVAALGIHAFLVMKLSGNPGNADPIGLGTLAFFHRRSHRFSWQEVSVFQSYCQRVSDTISLYQQNVALAESAENLRIQSLMLTRVEVVALLAHDLGHKTMEAAVAIEDYVAACKKALNSAAERRSHSHLDDKAAKAVQSTNQIGSALNQFRQLYKGGTELSGAKAPFDFQETVKYVETTLAGALARRKVTVKPQFTGSMKLTGHREILIQVLFNLFINSLDAISGTRPSSIFVHAHEEKQANPRRLVIQFWDSGPGINLRFFSKPEDIFEVGKTSKPTGTGTGLPVARRLLGQYFKGDIVLVKPEEARFRITIPDSDE